MAERISVVLLNETFPAVSQVTQTEIVIQIYAPKKLRYQLMDVGLRKHLVFHLLRHV